MRGIRLTKDEASLLEQLSAACNISTNGVKLDFSCYGKNANRLLASIATKINDAKQPSTNPSILPLEQVLVFNSGGKVTYLTDKLGYARASKQAGNLELSDESEFMAMGKWINAQSWIKVSNGHLTILDVLNKWSQWWPKVKANANTGQNTSKPGNVTTSGVTKKGFR